MQNHLTRILVTEFIYPAYIHSDTIYFMVGQVGLEPTIALSTWFTVRGDTNYTVLTQIRNIYLYCSILFFIAWINLEGHPGLKPGRLQDGGFTEIFLKNSAVKVFIKSRKEIGLPRPLCLSIPPMTHI